MRVHRKMRNTAGDYTFLVHIASAPCYFFTTTNADRPGAVGLIKQDNIFTFDNIHFEAGLNVNGQDVIENTTEGHPEKGTFFKLMGEPDVHVATRRRNTNFSHAYLNKTQAIPLPGVG